MLSKKVKEKSVGKMKQIRLLAVLLVPVVAFIMGAAAPEVWAQDDPVCWWNIELNASDLDVGVRGFFDYEPWKELEIKKGRSTFAEVEAENRSMRRQGFTEWFFESGEPPLYEVPFETFLNRFPVGKYRFKAETIEGDHVYCKEPLTHVIPCAPDIGVEEDNGDIIITWYPVETAVNTEATDGAVGDYGEEAEVDCEGGPLIEIVGYEVVVEEVESEKKYTINLPADVDEYKVTVPPEFLALGEKFQYEVLAIEESGNQTITEEEFCKFGVELQCPEED
jgi:hypothetical protein